MGRVKSKTTKNNHKKRNIVVAVVVAVILAVVLLMASNPHPGYSQLEKELDQITLPEGWSEVGPRTGEKDYWNMFCRDVTIDCPNISTELKISKTDNMLNDLSDNLQNLGFKEVIKESDCVSKEVNCTLRMIRDQTVVSLSARKIQGKDISGYMYVRKN